MCPCGGLYLPLPPYPHGPGFGLRWGFDFPFTYLDRLPGYHGYHNQIGFLRGVVFTLTAGPTALVLVRIGVLVAPLLTTTTPLVTLVTITKLVLGVSPVTLVGTI